MEPWFHVECIHHDTFVISEYQHWEETHCYVLIGSVSALLIDTGLGVTKLLPVVRSLTKLPIIVALTHTHWDHIGGLHEFQTIMVHEEEASWISGNFPLPLEVVKQNLMKEPCRMPSSFQEQAYQIYALGYSKQLKDQDVIDLGNRKLQVIHTPGHSPGHVCYYEAIRQELYSGDLIYKGCLDAFYPTTDPAMYRASLHKLKTLSIQKVYPGHHSLAITTSFMDAIIQAFDMLEQEGKLTHGAGIFSYDGFSIHL